MACSSSQTFTVSHRTEIHYRAFIGILDCTTMLVHTAPHNPSHQTTILDRRRQILSRRNPHALSEQEQRNRQQTEHAHDHTEDAKHKSRPVVNDPVSDEERPGERNDRAHDGRHHEAVAVHGLVGVDDLVS
jgi:hypothetical protein